MSRYKDQKSVRLPSDKESIGHHKVVRIRSSFRAHGQYEPLTTSWPGWHMVLATIVGFSPAMLAAERATAYRELARAMTPGMTDDERMACLWRAHEPADNARRRDEALAIAGQPPHPGTRRLAASNTAAGAARAAARRASAKNRGKHQGHSRWPPVGPLLVRRRTRHDGQGK